MHLDAGIIPKSKGRSWLVKLGGRNTTLMLLINVVFLGWGEADQ
jgi:hypothetical protein